MVRNACEKRRARGMRGKLGSKFVLFMVSRMYIFFNLFFTCFCGSLMPDMRLNKI